MTPSPNTRCRVGGITTTSKSALAQHRAVAGGGVTSTNSIGSHTCRTVRRNYTPKHRMRPRSLLEKEVVELRQKLAKVTRACDVLGHQIKKVSQLEAKVANLKHVNNVQLSIHQAEMESHRVEI